MEKYAFGYDFGTDSCRLVCVNIESGEIVSEEELRYPHGVITGYLPDTTIRLGTDTCLQDPADYVDVLVSLSQITLERTGIAPEKILCIGTDFTNCTVVPMQSNGRAMCENPIYRDNPHAWVKLWKHHAAEYCAEEIEKYALERWPRIVDYGNTVSSEWLFPKVLQILREDEEIYKLTDTYIEACDWIVFQMTGKLVRNSACLGVNAFYNEEEGGFPDRTFFRDIDSRMEYIIEEKIKGEIKPVGSAAGTLLPEMAQKMGLSEKTIVAVGHGDSEVAACGAGVVEDGSMLIVMGTSTCQQMMHKRKKAFKGLCAVVKDGMIPGMYAYESGQSAVGDIFKWFSQNAVSKELLEEANRRNLDMLKLLDEKAEKLNVGENGIVCLDWLNGNRSILMNYSLTGLSMGMTLETKPWEIYRGYVEATAFGCRMIIDSYRDAGISVRKIIATGGLTQKSKFVAQVYADILGVDVHVPQMRNMSAVGSAVCAAVALGKEQGGYENFASATSAMIHTDEIVYCADLKRHEIYNELYTIYCELYSYFGGKTDLMMRLKKIRNFSRNM